MPLTGNAWTARAGEFDTLTGYVEFTPAPGCTLVNAGINFKIGTSPVGTVFVPPGPSADNRYQIISNLFIPVPGQTTLGEPTADEPRTVTAEISGSCLNPPGPVAGTLTAVRSGVVGNR